MAEKSKSKKMGRAKVRCAAYRASYTKERNTARRLSHIVRKHPNDMQAFHHLVALLQLPFRNTDKQEFKLRAGIA